MPECNGCGMHFNKEKYETSQEQSYLRYPKYATWREEFLEPVIRQSHRVLKRGGYLLLNVADTVDHPIASDAARFAKTHFDHQTTIRLMLPELPHVPSGVRRQRGSRWEPIFVLQKRR